MTNLFVTSNGDGSFSLAAGGYVVIALLMFAALIAVAALGNHRKNLSTKHLVFSAVAIALAFVTSNIKLFKMPMGGSITLFSMFFITLIGYWYGPVIGILTGVSYGLLQMFIDPYIVSLPQLLVDYPLAFGALGISGFFRNKKQSLITGYIAGVLGRYFFAVLSGVIFFGMYAPETMSPLTYSLAYNGGYLAAEAALTIVVALIPAVHSGLNNIRSLAVEN